MSLGLKTKTNITHIIHHLSHHHINQKRKQNGKPCRNPFKAKHELAYILFCCRTMSIQLYMYSRQTVFLAVFFNVNTIPDRPARVTQKVLLVPFQNVLQNIIVTT